MGNYALGLGVVQGAVAGLEGKFRDRLGHAAALNDGYEYGGVDTAWGRFFDKLPWPKRDRKKAEEHLRRALQINPAALRARVYLASVYLDERPRGRGQAAARRGGAPPRSAATTRPRSGAPRRWPAGCSPSWRPSSSERGGGDRAAGGCG